MPHTDDIQFTRAWAEEQDRLDPLSRFRSEFHIPTLADLSRLTLHPSSSETPSPAADQPSIYLCGNSLGLQPTRTSRLISAFLAQWRTKGVKGHFVPHSDSPLAPFLHVDDAAAQLMAPLVGAADPSEVAVMGTLTANLHFLLSSFYRPDQTKQGRWKIMLEGKAFPSDHFAIESQVAMWGLNPEQAMVLLEPVNEKVPVLETEDILAAIDAHAAELAVILLPAIQFYTGQYFDIERITKYAHEKGVLIGWDCAHAAGNVELQLHDWDVDFAAWCSYKYMNSGPGAMAAIFVHERFGKVDMDAEQKFRPRLAGWWGDDKSGRFEMTNKFKPRPGAAGFQVSNPSALDLAAVVASLQIFNETTMAELRQRSLRLTRFLEQLLDKINATGDQYFTMITPRDPAARGAQLSVRLEQGFLEPVLEHLEANGVVIDERKPDVIRVAPAPLYNTFCDVWNFCEVFKTACAKAQAQKHPTTHDSEENHREM